MLLQDGPVTEVPQHSQMADRRMPWTEASLDWALQAMLLRPGSQPSLQNDGIQPLRRLWQHFVPVLGDVSHSSFHEDG